MSDVGGPFDAALTSLAGGDHARASRLIEELRSSMGGDASTAVRSRAARVAATAHRLAGDLAAAEECLAEAFLLAIDVSNDDPLVAVEAELEFGDLRRAQRRHDESAAAYDRAGRLAEDAGMPQAVQWKIALRSIDHDLTVDPMRGIERLQAFSGEVPDAPEEAISGLPSSLRALLRALDPVARGEVDRALELLEVAAAEARKNQDVPVYVASRIAIAQLYDGNDDHVGAYRSAATGWATLRAAIGPTAARDAFEPIMLDFRSRWGAAAFAEAKSAVESAADT